MGHRFVFNIYLAKKYKIGNNSATNEAREKLRAFLESSKFLKRVYVCCLNSKLIKKKNF